MRVTIDVPNFIISILLGWSPPGDDDAQVIGDSRVAYLSKKDPGHIFIPAAIWHDAAYTKGASIQEEWSRYEVDLEFLKKMLEIAKDDLSLTKEALYLYLIVRTFGEGLWEGTVKH